MAKIERSVTVDGKEYPVLIADETEALLAAKAAGRVFIGLPGNHNIPIPYMAENMEAVDLKYLEQVVRRHEGMPWIIAQSEGIILREFVLGDYEELNQVANPGGDELLENEESFTDREKFHAYIKNQYEFYQYGIWAMVRKTDKKILGFAGIYNGELGLELGYRTFRPWQRQGYAFEACSLILKYVQQEYACPLYARVKASNLLSINLLKKLGFEKYSESDQGWVQYAVNLR